MANETTQSDTATQAITLVKPAPGQTVVMDIQPNQVVDVPFDVAEAKVTLVGNDLHIEFPGKAVLILTNFAAMADAGTSPLMMHANATATALTETVTLVKPTPGQTVVVDIQPNQVVEVPFDMAEANITLVGNDLRLEFPGNAVLILTNFAALVDSGLAPLMMFADGTVVAGDVILTALSAEVPETAAGPGGGSGGAGDH